MCTQFFHLATAPAVLEMVDTLLIELHLVRPPFHVLPRHSTPFDALRRRIWRGSPWRTWQGMHLNTEEDVVRFATFYDEVFVRHGFRLWFHHRSPCGLPQCRLGKDFTLPPVMRQLGADRKIQAYEIGLTRVD